jgi:hypothetical protein
LGNLDFDMSKTVYTDLQETDNLQTNIMVFIGTWVREKKTPISRKEIMLELTRRKISRGTAEAAIHALIMKGFIRKAFTISNKTTYVMLRSV